VLTGWKCPSKSSTQLPAARKKMMLAAMTSKGEIAGQHPNLPALYWSCRVLNGSAQNPGPTLQPPRLNSSVSFSRLIQPAFGVQAHLQ
jgi:hypothetical protein